MTAALRDVPAGFFADHPAGWPISARHGLALLKDDAGQPLIFARGSDDGLYVIRPAADGGWEQIGLTAQFDLEPKRFDKRSLAQACQAVQDAKGRIWIAMALAGRDEEAGRLMVAGPLSNRAGAVNWRDVRPLFTPRPRAQGELRIAGLHLESGSATTPALFVQGRLPGSLGRVDHYAVDADKSHVDPPWRQIQLPSDVTELLDVSYGRHNKLEGLWALYKVGDDPVLEFTSALSVEFQTAIHVKYEAPPPGLRRILALPSPGNRSQSDLFVAGDGCFLYAAGQESAPVVIAPATRQSGIADLVVARAGDTTTVWCSGACGVLDRYVRVGGGDAAWLRQAAPIADLQRFALAAGASNEGFDLAGITPTPSLVVCRAEAAAQRTQIPLQNVWDSRPLSRLFLLTDPGTALNLCQAGLGTASENGTHREHREAVLANEPAHDGGRWHFEPVASGGHCISNKQSGLVLTGNADGSVCLWARTAEEQHHQHWQVQQMGDSGLRLNNIGLNLSLAHPGGQVRLAHADAEPAVCTWLLAPAGKAEMLELTVESITCVKPSTGQDGATDVLFMAIEIGAQIAAGAATGGASTGASAAATAAKAAASVSWAGVKAGAKAGAKAVTKQLVMAAAKKGALKAGVLTTGKVIASVADDSVAEALDVLSVKGAFNKLYGETPDDLYLKVDGRVLFPSVGTDVQLASQQTVQVGARHLFERSRGVSIELMEYDSGSDDDSLGAQTFAIPARTADFSGTVRFEEQLFDDEDGEGSLYLVTFSISELPSTL